MTAIEARREWMRIIKVPEDLIEAYMEECPPDSLEEELRDLAAAKRIDERNESRKQKSKD